MATDKTPAAVPKVNPARPLKIQTVYAFNPVTGEYVGEEAARESPLDPGEFMIPGSATKIAPPATIPAGQAAIFVSGAWSLVADNRGAMVYSTETGEASVVQSLGKLPAAFTSEAPSHPLAKWNGTAWVPPATPFDVWNGKAWSTDNAKLSASQWAEVRKKRTALLAASDWVVLPDSPFPPSAGPAWLKYRQDLRDVTQQKDPASINWPTAPI